MKKYTFVDEEFMLFALRHSPMVHFLCHEFEDEQSGPGISVSEIWNLSFLTRTLSNLRKMGLAIYSRKIHTHSLGIRVKRRVKLHDQKDSIPLNHNLTIFQG